jgi:hypothetical protein
MKLEKRVKNPEPVKTDESIPLGYSPNNKIENLIDAAIAASLIISTLSTVTYNHYQKVQEITGYLGQVVTDLAQYLSPFINS